MDERDECRARGHRVPGNERSIVSTCADAYRRMVKALQFSVIPADTFRPMSNRRDFIKTASAAAGGAFLTGALPELALAASELAATPATAPLTILVLGGTGYIGPHLVKHAVSRGHKVTTFTR